MPRAPLAADELERLKALRLCGVLDTPPDPAFDGLAKLAAHLCGTPVALVTLIDAERQWFKSSVGIPMSETHRDIAFCAHTILGDEPLIIEDTKLDHRSCDNPLVLAPPNVRFYAGAPLITSEGYALGSLCVLDVKPSSLSTQQIAGLKTLAQQVVSLLEQRRSQRLEKVRIDAVQRTRHRVGRLVAAIFIAGLALTVTLARLSHDEIHQQSLLQFDRLSQRVTRETTRRANQVGYGLHGARGVFAASQSVNRDQFKRYVASRDLPAEFPGAIGFGFIERVMRPDIDAFTAWQRADGAPAFSIHATSLPANGAADLFIIKYLNPLGQNQPLLGFDAGSDSRWREAIERCIRTGESAITAPMQLSQQSGASPAYMYLIPVYRNGVSPGTPDKREQELSGVLFAPVMLQGALNNIADVASGQLNIEIADSDQAATQLFAWRDAAPRKEVFAETMALSVGGRQWSCRTVTNAKFEASVDRATPWIVALAGTLLSGVLATLFWSIGLGRDRATALANSMIAGLSEASERAESAARQLNAKSMALAIQRERLELALSSGGVGTWDWNPQTGETHFDQRWAAIIGEEPQSHHVDEWTRRVHPEDLGAAQASIDKHLAGQVPFYESAHRLRHKDGSWRWIRAKGVVVSRDRTGRPARMVGISEDITRQKNAEEELRLSATHDRLTGLPNRALLHDRLQQCIRRAGRALGRPFALLFLDFDRFKWINDTMGHQAGDELLKMIATRLRSSLRPSDSVAVNQNFSMAGRLGGDEFVVILDEIATPEDATVVADRLLTVFAEPYVIGQHEVISTASIGIVTNNSGYSNADEMLSDADTAMYEAKAAGKGRYVVFDQQMRQRVERLVRIETDLRVAHDERQLFLMYQPIVSLQTGAIAGVEALVRWRHPQRGLVPPSEFIPIAEETGQILLIGQWVLREACAQFMRWQKELGTAAPPTISVNLSRKQLVMTNLPLTITQILTECGMEPHRLHLEVTETSVMKDAVASAGVLASIKQTGVKLEMDDFGTGHSSLASLHQFPIDVLKIDQSFIKNIERGRDFSALVQAIVQLARNLDIRVVAEGIETSEQAIFLGSLECELGQGYLFSRPLMPEQVAAFMAKPITMQTMLASNAANPAVAA